MAFVNLSLLLGAGLMAVPVILHLIMREKPQFFEFPALRFLKQRKEANRRQMRLRHWLLLLLRCAAVALVAAALARPSVQSADVGNWLLVGACGGALVIVLLLLAATLLEPHTRLVAIGLGVVAFLLASILTVVAYRTLNRNTGVVLGDNEAPVAAAIIFDTSPRMSYEHNNLTSLARAQRFAGWLMRQLPKDSEVAVLDSRPGRGVFSVDLGAAGVAIDGLEPTAISRPLPEVIDEALDLLERSQLARHEIYAFTDMTDPAWKAASQRLRTRLAGVSDTALYVIDVGASAPQNFALGDVRLSGEQLSQSSTLSLGVELARQGPAAEQAVELFLEQPDPTRPIIVDGKPLLPEATRRSRQSVQLAENGAQLLNFELRGLEVGTHHGRLEIVGGDSLGVDNIRYFTIEVCEAWPVLLVGGPGADTTFLAEALAPYEYRLSGQARFRCESIDLPQLADKELASYAAVCLLDPGGLRDSAWRELTRYVEGGGQLAIFLGRNANTSEMNQPQPQHLMPGKLARQWRAGGRTWYVSPRDYQHPLLSAFRPIATNVPWRQFPVERHWSFDDLNAGAAVIAHYNNGQPAIIEEAVGRGRVLVMTTPVSDAANIPGRPEWNRLPTGLDAWPFLMLANETMLYLVQSGDVKLNYLAGQTAVLRRRSETDPDTYLLFTPHGGAPQQITADDDLITVPITDALGAYRLKPLGSVGDTRGFSVNLPAEATDLQRVDIGRLDEILGEDRYRTATSREQIVREAGEARVGREFYSLLFALAGLMLGLEYVLANRFYKRND